MTEAISGERRKDFGGCWESNVSAKKGVDGIDMVRVCLR